MTIVKTVGLGGDFADYGEVGVYLYNSGQLLETIDTDFVFNQISDISGYNYQYPYYYFYAQVPISIEVNGNGYWSTSTGNLFSLASEWWSPGCILKFHDCKMCHTGTGSGACLSVPGSLLEGTEIYNNFMYSSDFTRTGYYKYGADVSNYFKLYNCIFYNLSSAIITNPSFSPVPLQKTVENCTLFNCGYGEAAALVIGENFLEEGVHGYNTIVRNVSMLRNDGIVGKDFLLDTVNSVMYNCAVSTNSFSDKYADHFNGIVNCLDGLNAEDNFLSTTFGDPNFLKPKNIEGASLFNAGIPPTVVTEDYVGNTYGGYGAYPIGAYQVDGVPWYLSGTETKTSYITVFELSANFEGAPVSGYPPLTVQFTDLSSGSPTSWDWDFGDGSPHSTDQNPTHTYNYYGVYTVSLAITLGDYSDSVTKVQYIIVVRDNVPEVLPVSDTAGGFYRLRGPTLIFD